MLWNKDVNWTQYDLLVIQKDVDKSVIIKRITT